MAATTPKTILLEVNGGERPLYEALAATATIKPGHIVKRSSATAITPIAAADQVNTRMIAVEAPTADDVSAAAINQAYDSGDNVRFVFAAPGDLVYMWLSDGQTASIGSLLATSGTAGELSVESSNTDIRLVGIAETAASPSGAAGRIKVRIL